MGEEPEPLGAVCGLCWGEGMTWPLPVPNNVLVSITGNTACAGPDGFSVNGAWELHNQGGCIFSGTFGDILMEWTADDGGGLGFFVVWKETGGIPDIAFVGNEMGPCNTSYTNANHIGVCGNVGVAGTVVGHNGTAQIITG